MKILAIEHELSRIRAEQFLPYLRAEAQQVWNLYQSGILREIYFRQDKNEAILILECENPEIAQESLFSLPLVREKLIEFEIIPLVPYPGLDRLFA